MPESACSIGSPLSRRGSSYPIRRVGETSPRFACGCRMARHHSATFRARWPGTRAARKDGGHGLVWRVPTGKCHLGSVDPACRARWDKLMLGRSATCSIGMSARDALPPVRQSPREGSRKRLAASPRPAPIPTVAICGAVPVAPQFGRSPASPTRSPAPGTQVPNREVFPWHKKRRAVPRPG